MGGISEPINEPGLVAVWRGRAVADRLAGGAARQVLYGLGGNDTLHGGDGADTLHGGAGADLLFGGTGDDRLFVRAADRARGGAGADVFVIEPGAGRAVIGDFQPGDQIDLSAFGLTFEARDPGLEDGFALRQIGSDLRLRLLDADGALLTLWLRDVGADAVSAADFLF